MCFVCFREFLNGSLCPQNPTGRGELRTLEPYGQPVFKLNAAGQNLELQGPNNAHDETRAKGRLEHFRGTFFGKLHQRLFKMLGLHRVARATGLQEFRRKRRDVGHTDRLAFGQRIANAQLPVVRDTNDVARPSFLRQLAVSSQNSTGFDTAITFFDLTWVNFIPRSK